MTSPLPLCVIGGGSIGMRHIECAMASDVVALTAIVEPSPPRRKELASIGLPVVADLDAVPVETSAAIVATPTQNHAQVAMDCLDRGWAVLVEKPLTHTHSEAGRLCAHAATLNLPLLTGHHRRCHPFVAEASKRIDTLGGLIAIQGIWCLRKHDSYYDAPWRTQAGAGPIMTNLSHEIDLLHCLAGPITEVSTMTSNAARGHQVEDTTAVSLRFESGAIGNFLMSDAAVSPWAFEAATGENPSIAVRGDDPIRFMGANGALGFPSLQTWGATSGSPPDWQHPLTDRAGPSLSKVDGIAMQLDRFAAVVQGAGDDFLATGEDGLRCMLVLDAIQKSAQSGRTEDVKHIL
jgi:predicted dehydrogenase